MGRNSTGAWTTGECLRIELSYLLKAGYLIQGKQTFGPLLWNRNGQPSGSVNVLSSWPADINEEPRIVLTYSTTDNHTGVKEDRTEVIHLEARPSNLGKGEVLYFICPSSGQRCRILYKGYNSRIWKSRQSYQHRLYYSSQKSSKLDAANDRYWELDGQIKKLIARRVVFFYKGEPTRRGKRLLRLQQEQRISDALRWGPESFAVGLRRTLYGDLPGFENVNEKSG